MAETTSAGLRTGGSEPPIGRHGELRRIEALISDLPARGGGLLITGEPGTGKSMVLRFAGDLARRHLQVLQAAGSRAERAMPFSGLNQLLRPVTALEDRIPQKLSGTMAAVFGEGDGTDQVFALGDRDLIGPIAAATAQLLAAAAAARPVVLVIDDVQWLDPASHEVLAIAVQDLSAAPIAVIAARRPGHLGPLAAAGLADMVLGPLTDAESLALLRRRGLLPPGPRFERVARLAAGNPLALVELSRAWAAMPDPVGEPDHGDPLTERLKDAFADRLDGLPARARDLALVTALHDDERLPALLAATAALSGRAPDAHEIAAAQSHGVLKHVTIPDGGAKAVPMPADDRLVFAHPLLRAVVLDAEPLVRIQAAHTAIALSAASGSDRAIWHRAHALAGHDERVADDLDACARAAVRRADFAAAAAAMERAAGVTSDPARRVARYLSAAGYCRELARQDAVDRLLAQAGRGPMGFLQRARAELLSLDIDSGAGDPATIGYLCGLATAAAAMGDRELGWDLLAAAALRCWRADAGAGARARVETSAERLARSEADGARSHPQRLLAVAMADPVGRCAEVISVLAAIAPPAVEAADPRTIAAWGMAARAVGACQQAAELLDRAETALRGQNRYGGLALISAMRAGALAAEGEIDKAYSATDLTAAISELTGQSAWSTGARTVVGLVAALRGDADTATEVASELTRDPTASLPSHLNSLICQIRGITLMSQGRHGEAYALLRRVFDPEGGAFHPTGRLSALGYLAEAAVHCGRAAEARAVSDEMARVYLSAPSSTLRTQIRVAEAVLAADDDAETACRADLAMTGLPLFARARIELAHGQRLRRGRQIAASRAPLAAAAAAFDRLGARPWADRAHAELHAAGERRQARIGSCAGAATLDVLSPQEGRIALLAAQGLTNREIGQRLHLAPRTVGSHLYRIFPKLGITARTQLATRVIEA